MSRDHHPIDQVRRFERFWQTHMRKAYKTIHAEGFSIADLRVLEELAFAGEGRTGAWLAGRLDLDTGYACRILKKLQAYDLVSACDSLHDGRMRDWSLTKHGRMLADGIEGGHRDRVRDSLLFLAAEDRRRLVAAMAVLEATLARVRS